jgi:hypothetical protein
MEVLPAAQVEIVASTFTAVRAFSICFFSPSLRMTRSAFTIACEMSS